MQSKPKLRMPADERREQILLVAIRLFSEFGFRGTTTKKIAEEIGISETLVFKFFSSKQELYYEIIEYKSKLIDNSLLEKGTALEEKDDFAFFYEIAFETLRHHREDEELIRLLFYAALEGHELTKIFFERFVVSFYERLSEYIEQRQKDGVFREVEPRMVVRAFIGMIIHHSVNNLLWDPTQQLLEVDDEKAAAEFANILLDGIRN